MTAQPVQFAIASDQSVSRAYSRQRLLNLYPETTPLGGQSPVLIIGRHGLKPWATAGDGPIRGSEVMAGVLYVVSGTTLYSVTSAGVATSIGTVAGSGFVIMSNNGRLGTPGNQLVIATGAAWVEYLNGYFIWGRDATAPQPGLAYLYNATTSAFGAIADPDLFLSGEGKFQISTVLNGSAYSATDFATAESSPGKLIRGKVDGADLFLFCEDVTEPWYNSGASPFPFERQNQTVIRKGIMGTHTIALLDNTIMWIGKDKDAGGSPIVYRLGLGLQGLRISTHAVEDVLATVTDWSLVKCISYIVNGHAFYQIILPAATSWVYDVATNHWHEESTFQLGRWQGNSHSYAYSQHIIGSFNSGDLFTLDPDYIWDGASTPIVAEMISVPIGDYVNWKTLASFQINFETGVGTLATGQGSDPQIMLQLSFDRGHTWGREKWRSIGKVGEFAKRVIWRQLGPFLGVDIKLKITDPVPRRFINYFADIQ